MRFCHDSRTSSESRAQKGRIGFLGLSVGGHLCLRLRSTAKGFVAIIPDYFANTDTTPGLTTIAQEIATHCDTWQQANSDCIKHIKLNIAAVDKVLMEFFAPERPELGDLGIPTVITTHAQIHHGTGDDLVWFSPNAEDIKQLLQKEISALPLFRYNGAGHSFIGDDS